MNPTRTHSRSMLACLGDASRFDLVYSLIEAERCVTELARKVGLSQSCTTRHLQVLAREGLVLGERQGKRVVFRLRRDEPSVIALLEWALSGGAIHVGADSGAGPRATTATRLAPLAAPRSRRRSRSGKRVGTRTDRGSHPSLEPGSVRSRPARGRRSGSVEPSSAVAPREPDGEPPPSHREPDYESSQELDRDSGGGDSQAVNRRYQDLEDYLL
jgi:DNA-binding transcriptional ArsR family regulator